VVGLEARREFDLGELRERRRRLLPLLAGIGGAAATVGVYLAFNAGRPSAHGWGTAMSTDTAFALGLLAVVGPRVPDRLRAFLLTVVVVDDLIGLIVIVGVYSGSIAVLPLTAAILFYSVAVVIRLLDLLPGRAAAADVPPVVGLRNRAGVRARERGDSDQQRVLRPRVQLANNLRDRVRLRRRQADRHPQRHLACRTRDARAAAPTGWLGCGRRRRHRRRHRLHRLTPDRHARLPRRPTRGSKTR